MDAENKRYRLLCALYDPSESTEPDKYMAVIPTFPNCVAWGDTPEETIAFLEDVLIKTIHTYQERGYRLPPGVTPMTTEVELLYKPRILEVSV